MAAVAQGLDWPRLVRLLDLYDADTHDDRVRQLQERRAEELETVELTRVLLALGRRPEIRGRLELLVELRLADVASIEEALRSVGAPLDLPAEPEEEGDDW